MPVIQTGLKRKWSQAFTSRWTPNCAMQGQRTLESELYKYVQ